MNYLENFLFSFTGLCYFLVYAITFYSVLNKNKIYDLFATILIFIFSLFFFGLRDQYSGVDTLTYVKIFKEATHGVASVSFEPAYQFFMELLSQFFDWRLYIFINVLFQLSFITISLYLFNVKKKSLLLLAYISFMPGFDLLTNGIRQGLAISVAQLIYSVAYYRKYLPKLSILLLILFHKSTLIFLPVLFLDRIESKKTLLLLIKILFFTFISLIAIWHLIDSRLDISTILNLLTFSLPGSTMSIGTKLNMYILIESDTMLIGIFKYYFLIILLLFLSIFIYFKEKIARKQLILKYALLVFIISVAYAFIWPSPFSYRFMYTAFLPALTLAVLTLNNANKLIYYIYMMLLILVAGILTYGSNTYAKFNVNI